LDRLNQPLWGRIKKALLKLEAEPPEGDIRKLVGAGGYRLRVGDVRILFDVITISENGNSGEAREVQIITVESILPRGAAYK
jgi:hypothetical protein